MDDQRKKAKDIDDYIAGFPEDVQEILNRLRITIRASAPEAEEAISYQMPTFKLKGNLVHFAAYKHHIGFYPTPSGIEAFKERLSAYECSKGTVKFLIQEPLPLELIGEIVRYRVRENLKKAESRSRKK